MPTTTPPESTLRGGEPTRLLALVNELRTLLARAKQLLDQEIHGYPTPIPRCDAQFNFLYEQRGRVARQLEDLGDLDADAPTEASCRRVLAEYLRSPPFSDLPAERALRARTAEGLAHDDR